MSIEESTSEALDELVRKLPDQPEEIGRIYETLGPAVLALIRSRASNQVDAEAICQDTWVSVISSLHRYNVKEPAWVMFRAFVFQVAKRKLIDRGRRKSTSEIPETYDPAAERSEDALERNETLSVMRDCIEALPDGFRAAVRGRMRGESPEETSRQLDIPVGTYQSRRNRGEKMVRECMEAKLN